MTDPRIDQLVTLGAVRLEPREVLDAAVLGVTLDGRLIYDGYLMARETSRADGMPLEEAAEWYAYNVWPERFEGHRPPLFLNTSPALWPIEEEDEEEE